MKEFTQIEKYRVEIWRRSYQRSMNLSVRADGQLRVTCGRRMPLREIARFVSDSEIFIQKRLLELESLRKKYPAKEIVSGETYLFFGEYRALEVVWSWSERARVTPHERTLELLAPLKASLSERRQALRNFYRKQARLHLYERVIFFSQQMGLTPRSLSIRGQKTRWGSCSASGAVNLNWKLLAAPASVIDYVVVHELAHLRFLDHSQKFWDLVAQHHPHWKSARQWLKEHEYEIGVQFAAD